MLNKWFFVCLFITFNFLSCDKKTSPLYIENNDDSYTVATNDKRILFSFVYNKEIASFPIRIIVPNYSLNYPMMIFINFDDDLNISSYKISDGKYFEDYVNVLPVDEGVITQRLRKNNNQIVYTVNNDGSFEVIDKSDITTIDQF